MEHGSVSNALSSAFRISGADNSSSSDDRPMGLRASSFIDVENNKKSLVEKEDESSTADIRAKKRRSALPAIVREGTRDL